MRVQSQLAHLTKRQQELNAEIRRPAEPLRADEQTLVGKLDERLLVEADLGNARQATDEIDAQLRETEQQRSEHQQFVNEMRELADNVRLAVRESQVRAETVGEQFAETGFLLDEDHAGPAGGRDRRSLERDVRAARAEDSTPGCDQPGGDRRVPRAVRAQEVSRRAVRRPHRSARDARERDSQDRS